MTSWKVFVAQLLTIIAGKSQTRKWALDKGGGLVWLLINPGPLARGDMQMAQGTAPLAVARIAHALCAVAPYGTPSGSHTGHGRLRALIWLTLLFPCMADMRASQACSGCAFGGPCGVWPRRVP